MATSVALAKMQSWMQTYLVHFGTEEEALSDASRAVDTSVEEAAQYILPTKDLTAIDRLEIYRVQYLMRMTDALKIDFYGIVDYLGEDDFERLVERYVQKFPSRNYNLDRLSDHFPEFILQDEKLARREFLHDLARLELAVVESFAAENAQPLAVETIQAVPEDAWERAVMHPMPGFRLLSFHYPVNDYIQAVKDNTPRPKARRQHSWTAVYRRGYDVWRLGLERPAYELLSALVSGVALSTAIDQAAARVSKKGMEKQIFQWFNTWVTQGIFQKVEY
ncbi:MAG: DNA-binding domain-containing protein [Blastocatellia bacterium]|nr:DNA-binding domain-containing protein [Blastocatellia bacterium]